MGVFNRCMKRLRKGASLLCCLRRGSNKAEMEEVYGVWERHELVQEKECYERSDKTEVEKSGEVITLVTGILDEIILGLQDDELQKTVATQTFSFDDYLAELRVDPVEFHVFYSEKAKSVLFSQWSKRNQWGILKNTHVIDWNQRLRFQAVHEKYISILAAVVEGKHLHFDQTCYRQVWMPPEKSKLIHLDDLSTTKFELRDLELHHSEIINRNWAYSELGTDKIVKDIIFYNGGVGLFLKGSDVPISWITIQFYFGLGMLHTLEEYRNKGFGSIVTKALCKRLVEMGTDPFAGIKHDNLSSLAMFKGLGFEEICLIYLCESNIV